MPRGGTSMNPGKTIFAQLLQQISHYQFRKIVDQYKGSHRIRSFSCWDQFIAMAFAQLTGRDSLRDIESCLSSHREKLYHMGLRSPISRSTLADANERRDFRLYQDFGYSLIKTAREPHQDRNLAIELDKPLYAFAFTPLELCR